MGTGVGSVTVPVVTLSATGTQMSYGAVTAPSVTVSGTGSRGRWGAGSVTVPIPVVLGAGGNRVNVPAPTLVAAGVSGEIGIGAVQAPQVVALGSAVSGNVGFGDVRVSVPEVAGYSGAFLDITVPVPAVAGSGLTGNTGVGSIFMPGPEVSGSLRSIASGLSGGDILVRAPAVSGTGTQITLISGSVEINTPSVQGSGVSGNAGSADMQVPLVLVDATGHVSTVGTAQVTIPAPKVEGSGITGVLAPVITGIAVNTRTAASSENTGLTINSMTDFSGVILAATDNGVVAVTSGVTDDGTLIQASVAGGVSDFNSTGLKKVIAAYVSCRASGEMQMSLITDEKAERVYKLLPRQTGLHPTKIRFGLGISGRYWQWKLANKGQSFDVNQITIEVETLERRIF